MPIVGENSGKGTDAKKVTYNLPGYEGDYKLKVISQREQIALLMSILPLDWMRRHESLPEDLNTQDKLSAWVDKLRLKLMEDVEFCAEFINCLENDEDVQDVLARIMAEFIRDNQLVKQALDENRTQGGGGGSYQGGNQTGDLLQRADCDKDKAAGNLIYTVNRAADRVLNLFEQIELNTDNDEMSVAFWDIIPVLGAAADEIIIQDLKTYFDNVRNWMNDAFIAEDTPEKREQTAYELLCLWERNGCYLSFDKMRDYFFKKAYEANPGFNDALGTIVDVYNFLQGRTTSFSGIWYVMLGIQFAHGWMLADMFGISLPQFKLYAKLGEPTDDWEVWEELYGSCECAVTYSCTNPIPELEVVTGLTGLCAEGFIAASVPFSSGGPTSAWIRAFMNIPLDSATGIEIVLNRNNAANWVFAVEYNDGTIIYNPIYSTLIGVDKYGIRVDLDHKTGAITSIGLKREDGNTDEFDWLEFTVYSDC